MAFQGFMGSYAITASNQTINLQSHFRSITIYIDPGASPIWVRLDSTAAVLGPSAGPNGVFQVTPTTPFYGIDSSNLAVASISFIGTGTTGNVNIVASS